MVLQYVAASFHLPSVSTANINTVQYTKPYQKYEIPTFPAVVTSEVLLPQSNIPQPLFIATAVRILKSLQACRHTANMESHNLQYGYLLVTPSDSYQKYPTTNIQHS